jgi:hypothetical protein
MMAMPVPVRRINMHFNISGKKGAINPDHGIEKIRTGIGIGLTRIYHLDFEGAALRDETGCTSRYNAEILPSSELMSFKKVNL